MFPCAEDPAATRVHSWVPGQQTATGAPIHDASHLFILQARLKLPLREEFKGGSQSLSRIDELLSLASPQVHRLHGVLSFAVRVQSAATHPASLLRERIVAWLAEFRDELRSLPEDRLQHFKVGLYTVWLAPQSLVTRPSTLDSKLLLEPVANQIPHRSPLS